MAQVVKYLLSKCDALSSSPHPQKKKKQEEGNVGDQCRSIHPCQ
jgi:hypothetical protein